MSSFDFNTMFPDTNSLEKYIEDNQALDIIDEKSDTILIFVCTHILYDRNSDPWIKVASKLLDHTPEEIKLNYQNPQGLTALILVSGINDTIVMKMLSFGADAVNINAIEKNNKNNALIYACESAENEQILAMLNFPSISKSLNVINKHNDTPLIIATSQGLNDVVMKMLEFPPEDLQLFHKDNNGNTALDISIETLPTATSRELESIMRDYERSEMYIPDDNDSENENGNSKMREFAHGEMPTLPVIPDQIIDTSQQGFNPIMRDDENITDYLNENKEDNIVILYQGKNYLLSRSIIQRQLADGIVFECINAEGIKDPPNIIKNLPLFNIKIIGIDISKDRVGLDPEFIYLDGIQHILESKDPYYSVIPLPDKILVSVISLNELRKIGTDEGSGYGSLHCQNGQGGMAGIIVPANVSKTGGKRKNRKTIKRRKQNTKNRKTKKNKKTIKRKQSRMRK